jgi:hypothetical protein
MKKLTISILMIAVFATGAFADGIGSAFGTMATGRAIGQGKGYFTAGIGAADLTSVVGMFDYGMSRFTTMRLKFGFVDAGGTSDLEPAIGAEFRWQLWSADTISRHPFDLSLGALFEYLKFDEKQGLDEVSLTVTQFGGFALGSYSFGMSNGRTLTPYGKFNVRVEDQSIAVTILTVRTSGSNSDIEFGFSGGVAYEVTRTINIYGELQLDGNDGFFFGLEFLVM